MFSNVSGLGQVEIRPNEDERNSQKENRLFGLREAPTLEPTEDEFKDPQEYIKSLRPLGEKYGILKIIPPSNWRPKFSLDTSSFKFITRKQKINRMGAVARSILDYSERICKYHYLNDNVVDGFPKTPAGHLIKLYELKCALENFRKESDDAFSWSDIAVKLNLQESDSKQLSEIYNSLILPYEHYVTFASSEKPFCDEFGKKKDPEQVKSTQQQSYDSRVKDEYSDDDEPIMLRLNLGYIKEGNKRRAINTNGRRTKDDYEEESELEDELEQARQQEVDEEEADEKDGCEICEYEISPGKHYFECSDCHRYYHCDCLDPNLSILTKHNIHTYSRWYCPYCLIGTCEFYFDETDYDYSLGEFKDRADEFKQEYLEEGQPSREISEWSRDNIESFVEKEFWKHVECLNDCNLSVEYGADIHCDTKGSGFPTIADSPFNKYSRHGWNLNNFPQLRKSLFHNMKQNISGVTVPWAYAGMMFSAFCWHSEDHYTYSVNYQHLGDTKTWYGIPGSQAEKFEQVARSSAPEIFEKQPNILFQRGTTISPELIVKANVDCYAIDQRAGQFVITFPKAYHAGFNHGFNFNEAVNYAPPDWVPYGLESVVSYQKRCKEPIFSHDALFIRTAEKDEHTDTAAWLLQYLKEMINRETQNIYLIEKKYPYLQKVHDKAESPDDDYYQCDKCKYMAYLSRVVALDSDGQPKCYCINHLPQNPVRLEVRFKESYLNDLYSRVSARIPHIISG